MVTLTVLLLYVTKKAIFSMNLQKKDKKIVIDFHWWTRQIR